MADYYCARILFGPVPGTLGEQLATAAHTHVTPVDRPANYVPPDDPLVAFLAAEGADTFDTDAGVVFEVSDDQAWYGLSQWFETEGDASGLDTLLIDRGIPFIASDDGRYEIQGRCVRWQPGQDYVHSVGVCDGEPALLLSEFQEYADRDRCSPGDPMLLTVIEDHFGLNLPPHPTEIAMTGEKR